MRKMYDITKGQLATLWIFGLITFLFATSISYNWFGTEESDFWDVIALITPFFLIFYTLGWREARRRSKPLKL